MTRKLFLAIVLSFAGTLLFAKVTVQKDAGGWRLFDNGTEVEVKGITWSNTPIGENYNYSIWTQDDEYIKKVIDYDMPLLKAMGITAIRSFNDVPPEWVEYIYYTYGIYTIINNLLGRYGVTVNGEWKFPTDYSDEPTREVLVQMAVDTAKKYKNTRGLLMYMLGNESNYGLEWSGTEIENLPVGDRHRAKAVYLYSMFEEAVCALKAEDPNHPVGIVNGDTQYIDLIAQYCPHLDVFGSNVYRGWKFYDSFYEDVQNTLDLPIVVTECGADAYNAITRQEDQWAQMQYIKSQQREVFEQAYGKGKCQNILGVFLFEWMDEWWKVYQYKDLDIHNDRATWANSGYSLDYAEGKNNMDEEWFGLVAQSTVKVDGINKRVPRAAYYMMQEVWKHSLYNSTAAEIAATFDGMNESLFLARGTENSVQQSAGEHQVLRISSLEVYGEAVAPMYVNKFMDNVKDGEDWKTAFKWANSEEETVEPTFRAETMLGLSFEPFDSLSGTVALTARSDAPTSHLRDAPGMYWRTETDSEGKEIRTFTYVDLYSAAFSYTNPAFDLTGFYHSGHGSYETTGDIFTITQEAYDLSGFDDDGSKAPVGLQFDGKGILSGLSVIGGPEITSGSRPQVVANWWHSFNTGLSAMPSIQTGVVWAEEFGSPLNMNYHPFDSFGAGRKMSLFAGTSLGDAVTLKLGLLHAGSEKLNAQYWSESADDIEKISVLDTLGGYLYAETGLIPYTTLFADVALRGLVADTNPAPRPVNGGGFIADSGQGNRLEARLGATAGFGAFTVQPLLRYRQPLQQPADRSLLWGSPFIVSSGNRQTLDMEVVLTYDPEGGTYLHSWDNNDTEQSWLAGSIALQYTAFAGKTDLIPAKGGETMKGTAKNADGTKEYNALAWWDSALPEQKNLWQAGGRLVWNPLKNLRVIGTLSLGTQGAYTGAANGTDHETITFVDTGIAARYNNLIGSLNVQVNSWGPETWWHNANNTFPLQFALDVAYGFEKPSFLDKSNRIGLRVEGRMFDSSHSGGDSYGALPASAYDADGSMKDGILYMELTGYCSLRIK